MTNRYRDIDPESWPKKTIRINADNMSLMLKLGEFQVVFKGHGSMPGTSLRMRNSDSFLHRFWLNYSALKISQYTK